LGFIFQPNLIKAVEREAGMSWKPLMSEAEAEEYTKDSYYQDQDFYHGTSQAAASAIASEGARLVSKVVNSYGDGLYLAFSKDLAKEYAIDYDRPSIISTKIQARKPKKFSDSIAFGDFLIENNIPSDDSQSKAVTVLLLSQGYDAVEVGGNRILVVIFDRKQVAVYKVEEL
jgi:hypothetical protein